MAKQIPIQFRIEGLFGEYTVVLPLDQQVNIFLGENGMGKTTILSCLYYTLSGKIEQLSTLSFKEIEVTFSNKKKLSLSKKDLTAYVEHFMSENRHFQMNVSRLFSDKEFASLRNEIVHAGNYNSEILTKYIYRFSEMYGIPKRYAEREIIRYLELYDDERSLGDYQAAQKFKEQISNLITYDILYFPTYRRIEEDISKLDLSLESDRKNVKDKLIQFGMSDVDNTIKGILDKIKSLAINGFTQMTGLLLKQYLNEEHVIDESKKKIDINKLIIALDRIGSEIADLDKSRIVEFVHNGAIYSKEKAYLRNLINQLIQSYESQNFYDNRVRQFVKICNGYLSNKKYHYNESKVELNIFRTDSTGEIDYSKIIHTQALSSGEKQIISIFSKLYLEKTEPCFVLFDEPELSLSIQWQEKFLPDIIQSESCVQLIAVTHSPFIFDNQFDEYARDMGSCLTWAGR
ncbi:MAG TPA: AAA family ATPase [Clostridia bacterium]|nr:AAA family ATPase [Clostridia bacterium]